jgi:hypothetical protein
MITRTSSPGFLEGVAVAAVAAVAGGSIHALGWLLLGPADSRALALAAVGLGYLVYLLWCSPEPAGRLSVVVAAVAATVMALLLAPAWTLPVQLGLVWLTRSIWLQRGPLAAIADLALVALGLGGALWAIGASGSLAAALWTFFLVQALFPVLGAAAARVMPAGSGADGTADAGQRFEQAERTAAASLRRLAAVRNGH